MASIQQVSALTLDGHYKAGTTIEIQVTFDEAVFVSGGTPTLALDSGGTATYVSGNGTPRLIFEYVVGSGDNSGDLSYTSTTALQLNGSAIQNGSSANATLTLPTPGNGASLSGNSDIVIDTIAPVFDPLTTGYSLGYIENDALALGASTVFQYYALVFNDNFSSVPGDFSLTQTATFEDGVELFTQNLVIGEDSGYIFATDTKDFHIGTTTNAFTLTDKAGNETTYSFDVIVNDYEKPTAVVPSTYEIVLDASGTVTLDAQALVDDGIVTVADNDDRGIASYRLLSEPNTSREGEVAYFTFAFVEDEPSVFKVRMIGYDANGAIATDGIGRSVDFTYTPAVDDDATNDSNLAAPILLNLGYMVYDPSGNSSGVGNGNAAVIALTIKDSTAPTAIAQSGLILELDENGMVELTADAFDNGSTDNLGIVSKAIASAATTAEQLDTATLRFDADDIGSQNITLTVTDSSDLTDSDTQSVQIVDLLDPTAAALTTFNLALDGNGQATLFASQLNNGSTDNTGAANLIFTLNIASLSVAGEAFYNFDATDINQSFNVTLSATDLGSNTVTTTTPTLVTVIDALAPVAIAQNFDIVINSGSAIVSASDINNGSTDNVGIASYQISGDGGTTFANDWTFTALGTYNVTLQVTDTSGNRSTSTAQVLVKEETPPVVQTQNVTVQLGADGTGSIVAADIDNGTYDPGFDTGAGSGIATLTLDRNSFSGSDLASSPITVTLTATDNSNNVATGTAQVTVVDLLAPVLSATPANTTAEADLIPTAPTITAADNVDGAVTVNFTEVITGDNDSTPYEYTLSRTWTASDNQG
ncbi:MAG: hypothetical protein VKJ64_21745, partial [Leptolyngbyaceae bacterium]|nr:hypothetical protein [Leptolyngbyaceae bacterium]